MKTQFFVLIFIFCVLNFTHAQVYIGPVAGGQISWTKFDKKDFYDSYKIKPVWGFHAGANISLKVRNRFFLHTSFLYSTKGKVVEGKTDLFLKNKVKYNFIEVPIVYAVDFRAKIGGGKEFKYYFGVGPNISYWLGGNGKLYNSDLEENADFASRDLDYRIVFGKDPNQFANDEMNVAEPNRIQLGLNVATGFVFEPGNNKKILFMLRYELGHSFLSNTSNGNFRPTYYQDILQSRNIGLRFSLTYLLDLRVEDSKRGKSTIKRKKV